MSEVNLDLAVLRLMRDREKYQRLKHMIPAGTVSKETASILKSYGKFFAAADTPLLTHAEFWPFLRSLYPKWSQKDIDFWHAATAPIDLPNPKGYDENVIRNLLATDLGNKALALIERHSAGDEVELAAELRTAVEAYEVATERRGKQEMVELGWDEMIEEESDDRGLTMRLACLDQHMKPLQGGAFGIVALRPDRGKTSVIASEVTHFAPQLVELHEGFRPVLWLNNEGPGRRILGRLRQAALGMSASEIRGIGPDEAQRRFIEAIGGREDMVQVKDIHGWRSTDVEEFIRKVNPGVVVFDMIDNIAFTGVTINGGERTDQFLEAMYQWARMLAVRFDFVGIASSQISDAGDEMQYPTQPMLKDSRTGKQGACDFIITGGFQAAMPNTRFIGMTKNKLKREGQASSPRCQVFFDADRSRLVMPTLTED